jgi:surface protein
MSSINKFNYESIVYLLEKLKNNFATKSEFKKKIDIETGKGLTENDFSNKDIADIQNKFTKCEVEKIDNNIHLKFYNNANELLSSCSVECGANSDVMLITSMTSDYVANPEENFILPIAFMSVNEGSGTCYINIKNLGNAEQEPSEKNLVFNNINQGKTDIDVGILNRGVNEISLYVLDKKGVKSNNINLVIECKNETQYTIIEVYIPEDNYTLQLVNDERQILEDGYVDWGDGSNNNISAVSIMIPSLADIGDFDEPLLENYPLYDEENNLIGYDYKQYLEDHLIYENQVDEANRGGILMLADPSTSSHTFSNSGSYTIKGKFTFGITEPSTSMQTCLRKVKQFSDLGTINLNNAFSNCKSLISVNYKGLNTTYVSSMALMHYNCVALQELISLENLSTSKVTSMSRVFSDCQLLSSLNLNHFDTVKVTDMSNMFYNCKGLTSLNVNNWDTSNVVNMYGVFNGCNNLSELDISNWKTNNVQYADYMFNNCSKVTSLDVSKWTTDKLTTAGYMFGGCSSIKSLNVSKFNMQNVTTTFDMFNNCYNLTSLDLSSWITTKFTKIHGMFVGCRALTSLNLSNWNTSNVTLMGSMFKTCQNLTSLDLSHFNTTNVIDMNNMFADCINLKNLNTSNFNTSKVTSMCNMFQNNYALESLDLRHFDVRNVQDFSRMFYGCYALKTLNISGWVTSKATTMERMFYGCSALTSIDVSSFNTSKVTSMNYMFDTCHALTTLNLSDFDLSATTKLICFIGGSGLKTIISPKNISYSISIYGCYNVKKSSILDIINNLKDYAAAGTTTTATITLPNRFSSELTASEQGAVILKGWNLAFL